MQGDEEGSFHGISTDSRNITPGCLFIALRGETYDGHDFLATAIEEGAAGVLAQRDYVQGQLPRNKNISVILVEDTLTALGDMAHAWRRKFAGPVIAVTGSSGKTTTKEMIAGIVGLTKNIAKTKGNFNNLIGVPLTLLSLHNHYDATILELGTNHRGEIERLTKIAEPDIGLITNIGPAHLEGLKSLDLVKKEKCDLFRNMTASGIAVINMDDEALKEMADVWRGEKITFGLGKNYDVSAENIVEHGERGTGFTLRLRSRREEIDLSIAGEHNVYNALAAAASSLALGMTPSVIRQGLTAFKPISGRMEILPLKNGAFVINDTYNANPASVREALKTLNNLRGVHRSIVILGDMLELGDYSEQMHEGIGRLMADTGVSTAFLRGRLSQATAAGAIDKGIPGKSILFFETAQEVTAHLKSMLQRGDWILVKGSRMMKMEEIVREIVEAFDQTLTTDRKEKK
jgi:UDP-N-acetylmuramoyl-tripeptide--D-alanyl-D-alanine ligase